jgi:WD40 repeat-containing protein SMU1
MLEISHQISSAPPNRLLTLLTHALKWQQQQGLLPPDYQYDLFRGVSTSQKTDHDAPPSKRFASIQFGKKHHCECASFSPSGLFFVTGTVDGFVEVWNHTTGKLRKDLDYQAKVSE